MRAERPERFHDLEVQWGTGAVGWRAVEDLAEERGGAVIAQGDQLLDNRIPRTCGKRPLEDREGRVGADLDDGTHRVALDLRIGIAEERLELRQGVVAAKDAEEVNRRPPH